MIFSIAAAFSLMSAGRLADAGTIYRRLGPSQRLAADPARNHGLLRLRDRSRRRAGRGRRRLVLRERLSPFRGQHVVSGAGAMAYNGPVELYLGMAAGHLGLLDDAVLDLQAASQLCAANGARGFQVRGAAPNSPPCWRAEAGRGTSHGRGSSRRKRGSWPRRSACAPGRPGHGGSSNASTGRVDTLTPREREVAALVAQGLTNRQIAAALQLSERTAQNHVQHILTKLDLANRSQIAVRTVRETSRAAE